MISRFERFSLAIFEISKYWNKIAADEMAKHGLKGAHSVYLVTLYEHGGMTAAKLSEMCSKDKADVSRAISQMVQKGLVQKTANGKNLYRAIISLTDEGKKATELLHQRIHLAVETAGKGVCDEHRAIFYDAMTTITSNLKTLSQEGIPEK